MSALEGLSFRTSRRQNIACCLPCIYVINVRCHDCIYDFRKRLLCKDGPVDNLLWQPSSELAETSEMTRFMRARGFGDYGSLWRWSVSDVEAFWASLWEWFEIDGTYERVLARREMPGAEWFPGAE